MRVTGAQQGIFRDQTGFLKLGHFDNYFMRDIQKKGSAGKNLINFFFWTIPLKLHFKWEFSTEMHTNRAICSKVMTFFSYFQNKYQTSPLRLASCAFKNGWCSTNFFFMIMFKVRFSKTSLWILKAQLHMATNCHIGLIDNNRNRYRMWAYRNNSLCSLR